MGKRRNKKVEGGSVVKGGRSADYSGAVPSKGAMFEEYRGVEPNTLELRPIRRRGQKYIMPRHNKSRRFKAGRMSVREAMGTLDRPICVNLTKHQAGPDLMNDETFTVIGFVGEEWARLQELQTFRETPTAEVVRDRAKRIATMAANTRAKYAWVAGAPYLLRPLEEELEKLGITPVYTYSNREFKDVIDEETGKVREVRDYHFEGWIIPKLGKIGECSDSKDF